MASKRANHDSQDRITQLPEAILHSIIFYLQQIDESLKSVIHFGISSKSCHQAWLSCPHFSFALQRRYCYNAIIEKESNFINRVERSLQRALAQGLTINTFKLLLKDLSESNHLNQWIQWVHALRVQVIDLQFLNNNFMVRMSLFSDINSLQELSLRCCILERTEYDSQEKGIIRLPSLRKLRLNHVNTSIKTVEGIIQGCPLLESLEILSCTEFRSVDDSRLLNLQYGVLKKILIQAPCLKELSYQWRGKLTPGFDVTSWPGLRKLSLTGGIFSDLRHLLAPLTQLEYLSFTDCHWQKNMSFSSSLIEVPSLQPAKLKYLALKLGECYYFPFKILDDVFGICHPEYIAIAFFRRHKEDLDNFLQSIRNMLMKKIRTFECGSCDGRELHQCWHPFLRDVKLESSETTQGHHGELDIQPRDLDGLSQQAMDQTDSVYLRVSFKLTWK